MKKKIIATMLLAFLSFSTERVIAQPPPDPGGAPVGETPLGGGAAPLGAGTVLLVVLSAAYGVKKWKKSAD